MYIYEIINEQNLLIKEQINEYDFSAKRALKCYPCMLTMSQANTVGWVGEPIINLSILYQFLSPAHICKYLTMIRNLKPKKLKHGWTKDFCFSVVFILSLWQKYQIEKTWENHLATVWGFQTLTTCHKLGENTMLVGACSGEELLTLSQTSKSKTRQEKVLGKYGSLSGNQVSKTWAWVQFIFKPHYL